VIDVAHDGHHGRPPLAIILDHATHAQEPGWFTTAPVGAMKKLYSKLGWTPKDVDLYEINEAFAVVPLVSTLIMGGRDQKKAEAIRNKTNVNGGAIAIGHPTGATGARMIMTLMYELRRRRAAAKDSRPYYGLATLCGGIGEGEAVIVRVDG